MNHVIRKRWAAVKANNDVVCIETRSGYRNGMMDEQGAQYLLATDANEATLGSAVMEALSRSRFVLPAPQEDVWIHPDTTFDPDLYDYKKSGERYQAWVSGLMTRFGYKTRHALFKNMMNCLVTDSGGVLTFQPTRHVKLEAWEGLSQDGAENVIIPTTSSPADIGAALRLALSRCV